MYSAWGGILYLDRRYHLCSHCCPPPPFLSLSPSIPLYLSLSLYISHPLSLPVSLSLSLSISLCIYSISLFLSLYLPLSLYLSFSLSCSLSFFLSPSVFLSFFLSLDISCPSLYLSSSSLICKLWQWEWIAFFCNSLVTGLNFGGDQSNR